jgi:hypothetical protein
MANTLAITDEVDRSNAFERDALEVVPAVLFAEFTPTLLPHPPK